MIFRRGGFGARTLAVGPRKAGESTKTWAGSGKVHTARKPRGADADHGNVDGVELGAGHCRQAVSHDRDVLVIASG